jgi:hypothetical protein
MKNAQATEKRDWYELGQEEDEAGDGSGGA